jgi:polar amino acid transport system substrate-binding protein
VIGALALATLFAAATIPAAAQLASLRLVSTAWTPFTNEAGKPRFALDLVEAALGRVRLTAKTAIVEPAQFTPALLGNSYDGSAAAWRDAERERAMVYSQPYLENRLVLVGRRDADVSATALGQLAGKRVAIVEGYSYGDTIELSGAVFVRSRSEEDSLSMLLNSKADYVLMDELVVEYIVSNYPQQAQARLQIGSKPLLTRPLYFVVRRSRPDAESIVNQFNQQLRGMIADRTYHRLLHVAWIRADIDGDGKPELVPQSDSAGAAAPTNVYTLFSSDQGGTSKESADDSRYYVGGDTYVNWATIPDKYKVDDPAKQVPSRSGGTIFKFAW